MRWVWRRRNCKHLETTREYAPYGSWLECNYCGKVLEEGQL